MFILTDDVILEILYLLNIPDALSFSSTNREIRELSELSSFWKQKIMKDFPDHITSHFEDMTMKQIYFELYKSEHTINVHLNLKLLTTLVSLPHFTPLKYIKQLTHLLESTEYVILLRHYEDIVAWYYEMSDGDALIISKELYINNILIIHPSSLTGIDDILDRKLVEFSQTLHKVSTQSPYAFCTDFMSPVLERLKYMFMVKCKTDHKHRMHSHLPSKMYFNPISQSIHTHVSDNEGSVYMVIGYTYPPINYTDGTVVYIYVFLHEHKILLPGVNIIEDDIEQFIRKCKNIEPNPHNVFDFVIKTLKRRGEILYI